MLQILRCIFIITTIIMHLMSVSAQNRRYLDSIFDEVEISDPIELAENYSILNGIKTGGNDHTQRQSLVSQFYTPKGDNKTDRPLIIYVHTGNFFPYPANGGCSGTLRDSSNVEIATRLAKMGYVVAVVNYRQGWNPFVQGQLVQRFHLINALYRAKQDVSSYIRYFRKSIVEMNNPHGINPDKITVWGERTGGFIALAAAYLNNFSEFHPAHEPSTFILPTASGNVSMIDEKYNGNIHGDGPVTIVDESYSILTGLYQGDTLCISNHPGYSSDFALVVNMSGALADSSWLKKDDIPLISFHVASDVLIPCHTDGWSPPFIIRILCSSGSCDLAARADNFGNNDVFKTIPAGYDPYGAFNKSGHLGFYAFDNTPDDTSGPWEWAAADNPPSTCNKNANIAKTYIDTIIGYFAPRACVALGLNCDFASSTTELKDANVNLKMLPNPASLNVTISVSARTPIRSINVFDISGRMVKSITNINSDNYLLNRENLQSGLYLIRMQFEGGVLTKKLIFD